MMKHYVFNLLTFLFCMSTGSLWAQGENNNWHFGLKHALNFNVNPPLHQQSSMKTYESSVSVSDSLGNLLFYTMGSRIWNRDGVEMFNSNGLLGNGPVVNGQPTGSSAYGVQVIKHPGHPNQYFVFSGDAAEENTYNIYYSLVDMMLDNGKGGVVNGVKNILLLDNGSEYMVVAKGGDCKSYWLLVRSRDVLTRPFLAYKIDINGVNPVPVVTIPPPAAIGNSMPMVLAKDGTLYSLGQELIISKFNNLTGSVYDFRSFAAPVPGYIALSPDHSKLYLSTASTGISQYNLSLLPNLTAVQNSVQTVSPPPQPGLNILYMDMRVGPDEKMYILRRSVVNSTISQYIDRMNTPNMLGSGVGYVSGVYSGTMPWSPVVNVFWSFGEDIVINPTRDTVVNSVQDTLVCFGAAVTLKAYDENAAFYHWSNGATGYHTAVVEDGIYWVYSTDNCRTLIDTFHVDFIRFDLPLPSDTPLCEGQTITFDVSQPIIEQYVWNDGDINSMKQISGEGTYSVTATSGPCTLSDTVQVYLLQPKVDILGNDTSMCMSTRVALSARANVAGTFSWNTGDTGTKVLPSYTGEYIVTHSNVCGQYQDSVYVTLNECTCDVMIPNAFTPNGDGRNDVFAVECAQGCNPELYEMYIYNRYGHTVFYSCKADKGWDGTVNKQAATPGVYMYYVRYTDRYTGETKMYKGDLMLMR